MIEGPLLARKANDDPPGYRIVFDDGSSTGPVEVGSVSQRDRHTDGNRTYWHWGIDTMPLINAGGRVPSGEAATREEALQAFRDAFFPWVNELHPGDWQRNRDKLKRV